MAVIGRHWPHQIVGFKIENKSHVSGYFPQDFETNPSDWMNLVRIRPCHVVFGLRSLVLPGQQEDQLLFTMEASNTTQSPRAFNF